MITVSLLGTLFSMIYNAIEILGVLIQIISKKQLQKESVLKQLY